MIDYLLENGIKSAVFWCIGLLMLWFACATFLPGSVAGSFPSIPKEKWQAVFLGNSQVYFGHIQEISTNYITLSDVYYLQTATDLTQNQTATSKLNLIKLGGEVHGPEDTIYIPKSTILFWENMKNTSRVVQTIINTKQ